MRGKRSQEDNKIPVCSARILMGQTDDTKKADDTCTTNSVESCNSCGEYKPKHHTKRDENKAARKNRNTNKPKTQARTDDTQKQILLFF